MNRPVAYLAALFAAWLSLSTAMADDIVVFQSAAIEDAYLTPAGTGGTSTLRMRITNEGFDNMTVLGVGGKSFQRSRIIAKLGDLEYAELDSISIPREESLDMTSMHLFVQLNNMDKPVKTGDVVNLTLVLPYGELPFQAHVRAN
ncbi:copper chaperone PCu(A)C [Sneathiella chinensis]|uniref:Copper chaperone PCu(A)C n=1 Tax=Sneathiella chinensis TaxID=349750 RepID=A0ABQ5U6C3_9PROT|nr:copper chaperone PCu(A)C [Sneathiella chinensis]GLQ07448.1 hypothetical protein GCM10007924_26690 [Sneathiella chinensis]